MINLSKEQYKDLKQINVSSFYKENLQGKEIINPVLGKIIFSRRGLGETIHRTKRKLHPFICLLKELVETGSCDNILELPIHDRKDRITGFYHIKNSIKLAFIYVDLDILIAEDQDGNKYYMFKKDLQGNLGEDLSSQRGPRRSNYIINEINKKIKSNELDEFKEGEVYWIGDTIKIEIEKIDSWEQNKNNGLNEKLEDVIQVLNEDELINYLKNNKFAYRIVYDRNKDIYIVGPAYRTIHEQLLMSLISSYGLSYSQRMKYLNENKFDYLMFTPKTEDIKIGFDNNDKAYSFKGFGTIYTKGQELVSSLNNKLCSNFKLKIYEEFNMNIKQLNEKLKGLLNEYVDQEEKQQEINKYQELCKVAYEALENVQTWLEDHNIDPANGEMDQHSAELYDKLTDMISYLYSATLVDINESKIEKDILGQGKNISSDELGIGLSVHSFGKEIYLGSYTPSNIAIVFRGDSEEAVQEVTDEIAEVIKSSIDDIEENVLTILDNAGFKKNV